jgi:hypothetical protein
MSLLMKIAVRGEKLVYRIGGLPVALRSSQGDRACDIIRRAYAHAYWRPGSWDGYAEIAAAWLLWPIIAFIGPLRFTAKNGPAMRRRYGRGLIPQFLDQVRLFFTDGVVAPWYYIFELAKEPTSERAELFLQRSETKAGIYPLLRRGVTTELNDKKIFADYCAEKAVPCVPYLFYLDGSEVVGDELPDCDLFVKPAGGRGGRGAERWDFAGQGVFTGPEGERLNGSELLTRLNERAKQRPLLVQRRVSADPEVTDLTTGALPTVRVTTCLGEQGEPEVVGAVFRMAIGSNRTVDNLHAGGIAAGVDLETGALSAASNLGMDARLGWLDRHPDTAAEITGRKLPQWAEIKALAVQAHRAFADRVLVGWDIGVTDQGPLVVEGNSSPDLDIVQRFGEPACAARLGELLAWHLRERGFVPEAGKSESRVKSEQQSGAG